MICPAAAAAWLSSSRARRGSSLSSPMPSATAPDDTMTTSLPSRRRSATSAHTPSSHARFIAPVVWSTNSAEPILMTRRRAFASRSVFVRGPGLIMEPLSIGSPAPACSRRWNSSATFGRGRAARDGHRAAADHGHHVGDSGDALQEPVDVLAAADELHRVMALRVVEHARVELLHRGLELLAGAVRDLQLEQRELALDVIRARHVGDLDHVDELAELLADLLDDGVGARSHEREPRHGLVGRGRDIQALDVVAARGKEVRDARERSRLVLQKDGDDMSHRGTSAAPREPIMLAEIHGYCNALSFRQNSEDSMA